MVRIARSLNESGARYVIIGGIAMAFHGYARATRDLDLLVDPTPENVARLRRALSVLEDQAVLELDDSDVQTYRVVRVADEVVVDLLAEACGNTYEQVSDQIESFELDGVSVPILSPRALIKTKQTVREKDAIDCSFLAALDSADDD
ncbi:MAG: nucleotidyltransferase [Proteobacteria bacterium]|nr:nucleotidyltransferase [Pseudomonadota bacterium]